MRGVETSARGLFWDDRSCALPSHGPRESLERSILHIGLNTFSEIRVRNETGAGAGGFAELALHVYACPRRTDICLSFSPRNSRVVVSRYPRFGRWRVQTQTRATRVWRIFHITLDRTSTRESSSPLWLSSPLSHSQNPDVEWYIALYWRRETMRRRSFSS